MNINVLMILNPIFDDHWINDSGDGHNFFNDESINDAMIIKLMIVEEGL